MYRSITSYYKYTAGCMKTDVIIKKPLNVIWHFLGIIRKISGVVFNKSNIILHVQLYVF